MTQEEMEVGQYWHEIDTQAHKIAKAIEAGNNCDTFNKDVFKRVRELIPTTLSGGKSHTFIDRVQGPFGHYHSQLRREFRQTAYHGKTSLTLKINA